MQLWSMLIFFLKRWYLVKKWSDRKTFVPCTSFCSWKVDFSGNIRWEMLSENSLKICLYLISFLPSISLYDILKALFGISLQVLASTPRNPPILSNFYFFDKISSLSHKSNSYFRLIIYLPRNIFVRFNFLFFCSLSETPYWLLFDELCGVNRYLLLFW